MKKKIRQHDITDCGAACLASVAAHYKLGIPVSKIRMMAGTDQLGTSAWGLIKAAGQLGFSAKGVRGGMDDLRGINCPLIAHVILNQALLHFVVIYNLGTDNLAYMDPADGEMHNATYREFGEIWTGVMILLTPGPEFQPKDITIPACKRFALLLKPHRNILFKALLGAIIYTLLGLSTSIYIQKITDFVLVDRDIKMLNVLSITMVAVVLFQVLTGVVKNYLVLRTGQKIDTALILGYYNHLLKLPQYFFDSMRVGEIISRINDAVKIRAFINDIAISLLVSLFIVIFSFGLMFMYNWKLALIISAVIPIYLIIYLISNQLNKKRERKLMEDAAELESQLVESLKSVRTIKEFGLEEYSNMKTEGRFANLLKSTQLSAINTLFTSAGTELASRAMTIILLWIGAYYVVDHTITPGELLSFFAIAAYFTGPASNLVGMNKAVQNALIAADRLFEIMDLDPETEENKPEFPLKSIGDIRFCDINFTYGTRNDVFDRFSFNIKRGKITAVVGESGSGKSTMVALVMKLYPIASGKITIGGANLENYSPGSLRKLIGIVPQHLDIFAGTLIENIAIGEKSPNQEKIMEIMASLGMNTFVEKLPDGYNTRIGENGTALSGGEKQRIAIARALYRDPEILLFDEATSSLDNEAERYVQETMAQLRRKGKTILVIAHRLSTVIQADHIAVMENGKIVEEGTHPHLWEKMGKYYQMWIKQLPFPCEVATKNRKYTPKEICSEAI